jgi:glutaminase
MDYQEALAKAFEEVSLKEVTGELATYIPELTKVDPGKFGVHLHTIDGESFGHGHHQEPFSIQSISKVLALCMAYRLMGEGLWHRLGVEPSGTAFNSLVQLETDRGIPRNPFINAGAMVICDILISQFQKPKEEFLQFVRQVSEKETLDYSSHIAESEKLVGHRNKALCYFIKSFGNIHNDPEEVLDFYFNLCSLEMSCSELAKTFLFLANGGKMLSGNSILNPSQTKRINALMQTCGFYDESGEFTFKVGLPGKSGVGGGIVALHPQYYTISVWSPLLNSKGNSQRGVNFLELFTTLMERSIF